MFNDDYVILFSEFLYKSICCGYSVELPQLVEAIQMRPTTYVLKRRRKTVHWLKSKVY